MNWTTLKKRLGLEGHTHAGHFVAPNFALDLEPGFVAAARLNPAKRQVQSVSLSEFPAAALVPSANKSNVTDAKLIRRSIDEVTKRAGNGGGRAGLLIPDVAVRVALLQFETLPDSHGEAEALVRWKMREYLPYAPDEARLNFQVVGKQPGSIEVLGMAVRSSVLAEYESASGIGGGPALVLPATVALLPLLPEDAAGQLLLHLSPGALTAVVVAANRLRYWRTRALEGDPGSAVQEVGREAARVLAACQDNLAVQVENVWWCERVPAGARLELESTLEQVLGRKLRTLPASFLPPAGLPSGQREVFDQIGMPFAGLMANLN